MKVQYIITRERKNEIKDIVIDILKKSSVSFLPVDVFKISEAYKIDCIKADALIARGLDVSSDKFDALTIRSDEKYCIYYNPKVHKTRIRYTLACQLAHIFLGHLENSIEDEAAQLEARYFADELLMPISVLDSFGCRSAEEIAQKCEVSHIAGKIRMRDFERRDKYKKENGETPYDMEFLNIFFGK